MRILFTLCIVFLASTCFAQESENPSPSILCLDTTVNTAELFNKEVMKYAPGFRGIGPDNSTRGEVMYSYMDGGDGFVRIEYKYTTQHGQPVVIYQSVTADLSVIIPIVNGLFGTSMPADIQHATQVSGPIDYDGKQYQCLLQADAYKAGYWVLSFVK